MVSLYGPRDTTIASGVDAAGACAVRSNLYAFAAFLGRDRKLAEPADRNGFSTELSPDFGENRDQYLCCAWIK